MPGSCPSVETVAALSAWRPTIGTKRGPAEPVGSAASEEGSILLARCFAIWDRTLWLKFVIDSIRDGKSAIVQNHSENGCAQHAQLLHDLARPLSPCGVCLDDKHQPVNAKAGRRRASTCVHGRMTQYVFEADAQLVHSVLQPFRNFARTQIELGVGGSRGHNPKIAVLRFVNKLVHRARVAKRFRHPFLVAHSEVAMQEWRCKIGVHGADQPVALLRQNLATSGTNRGRSVSVFKAREEDDLRRLLRPCGRENAVH